ncbi:inositol monophosphatase 1-like [Chironomus tepperi]|uniref:inositol monophosphatase 1-like n=1 Tax=Chironomus tepperi TaxID=113505 RepID=UPI00391F4D84
MTPEELNECFVFVENLVRQCGEILIYGFKDCGEVENKGSHYDLVTIYDRKIENVLINGIKEKYPKHKFIAEEEQSSTKQPPILTPNPTWIIDPIDGTTNFVKKLHFVCISVALVIDNDIKIAFLFNPILNEFFSARKGQGAFLNGNRIFASKSEELKGSLIAQCIHVGAIPAFQHLFMERTVTFLRKSIGIRVFGSAALTLAYVASGVIDAYTIEYLKPWDIAAGVLIIHEAGGVVIDINGGEYNIMKPNIIAAGTLKIALEIKEIFDEIDERLEAEGKHPRQLMDKSKMFKSQ